MKFCDNSAVPQCLSFCFLGSRIDWETNPLSFRRSQNSASPVTGPGKLVQHFELGLQTCISEKGVRTLQMVMLNPFISFYDILYGNHWE